MNFIELKENIEQEISGIPDSFSIYIETDEGSIAIHDKKKRRAASLIKIPILMEGFRQLETEKVNKDTLVYIDDTMSVGGSGVISYLSKPYVCSIENLLKLMIIVSDNTATNILLDKLQLDKVNTMADSIGCKDTVIERKLMDKKAQVAGLDNYTSAKDMIFLLKTMYNNSNLFSKKSRLQMLEILGDQQFMHKLPLYNQEKDGVSIFNKTGELEGVEHDAAILESKDSTIYAAVLSEDLHPNAKGQNHISNIGRFLIEYLKK